MMDISILIELLLLLAAAFYLFVHIGLIIGLKRLDDSKSSDHPFVSVIVAARNEEQNISHLLQCLLNQSYSNDEIIIVNDRSTDKTAEMIANYQKNHPNIKRIDISNLPGDMPAKKNALRAGIRASKGEILCFTDADCFPPPRWIEELVKSFTPNVGLVAGYSPYQVPHGQISHAGFFQKLFYKFIVYEEYRAAIWASGSIGWNLGWLCTGRNLAYRRTVYDEVNGFEKIKMSISGDDDLFLQLVRRQTSSKIKYITPEESFVPTVPPMNFWSFIEQRKRHFSVTKFFTLPMMLFFFFYHSANLLLLISPMLLLTKLLSLQVPIALFCSKLICDMILFKYSHRTFHVSDFQSSFLLMEGLYILYNSCIGPLGFFRKFAWKQS